MMIDETEEESRQMICQKGMESSSGMQSITESRNHLLNHMDLLVLQFVCSLQASIRTYFGTLERQGILTRPEETD